MKNFNPMKCALVFFIICPLLFFNHCSKEKNFSSRDSQGCRAAECHISTPLNQYPPQSGKHPQHLRGYDCDTCHSGYLTNSTHKNGRIDGNLNGSGGGVVNIVIFGSSGISSLWDSNAAKCSNISCHLGKGMTGNTNLRIRGTFTARDAPAVSWYAVEDSGCETCHAAGTVIDPLSTNGEGLLGKHKAHVEKKHIGCEACHYGYKDMTTHMNGLYGISEPGAIVNFGGSYNGAVVKAEFIDDNGAVGKCENISCHGSANWYTDQPMSCSGCHSGGSSIDPVVMNGSGSKGKHEKHVSNLNLLCDKCHYNYKASSTHANGTMHSGEASESIIFFDSTNPGGQWINDTGYQTGGCTGLACHGASAVLNWYSDNTMPVMTCPDCHKGAVGSRRQVFDSNGDGSGSGGDFNRESHHVIDYSNRTHQIVKGSDCEVCHDQANHMSGTIRLKDKDNDGQVIVYSPLNPSSLETFCLSCHDSNGANGVMNPFSSGNILGSGKNVAGSRIKDNWLKSYGHGTNGSHTPGDRLTCLGTGQPGTGCHGNSGAVNAHGSANKVIAAREYNYPLISGYYTETWFSLCFDCHAVYPGKTKEDTLGVKQNGILDKKAWLDGCSACHFSYHPTSSPPYYTGGVTTHFADHDAAGDPYGLNDGPNPYLAIPTDNNLHWLHLGMYDSGNPRGSGLSLVVCSNCHSVHGSNTRYGAVHDEMGYVNISDGNGNTYGMMKESAYGAGAKALFSIYPTYCNMNCHARETAGPTRAWFSPISE